MVELKGVRMIRYLVDNETWAVNETLYNSIPVHLPPPQNNIGRSFEGGAVGLPSRHAYARRITMASTRHDTTQGFANMTGAYYGATVFLSNPHMLGANTSWPSLISGTSVYFYSCGCRVSV
jgi:hypothetical protein